ncbi:hypothetical protein [Salicibibacter kimchii]
MLICLEQVEAWDKKPSPRSGDLESVDRSRFLATQAREPAFHYQPQ